MVPGLDVTPKEFSDAMTLSGSKVEGVEILDEDLKNIVVGKIEKIEKHPDADKLIVCQVNIGEAEPVQIVTGAKNVNEGDLVPVVLDGGRVATDHDGKKVPGGTKIKKGKLRGVLSNGMMCSIFELGSSPDYYPDADPDGIYILGDDAKPGESAIDYLGFNDAVVEYEITSNRVDCFSVIGIAREAAATFRKEFDPPRVKETGNSEDASDYVRVEVHNKELCPRYTARIVKNIKIEPSPKWMQQRLAKHGIRPINNIVDITNYVMEEYGQPMHAYDLDTIEGGEIVVRTAKSGEKFTTLDGQERELDENILMICDAKKPIGLAGIMGGENSMITDNVSTMLFEAANFDGTNIRLSSKKVGLRTDASSKFEKGLDPNTAIIAINRACQLVEELGAGEVVGGVVDVYGNRRTGNTVAFEPDKINALLGTDIPEEEMIGYLEKISLKYDADKREINVPSWRQDVLCTADVAEEVARFFGYDKIPVSLPASSATPGKLSYKLEIEKLARNVAENNGFSQGMCYSFESPKVFDRLLIPKDSDIRKAVTISNPLGEDFSIMRTIPLNGILGSLAMNYKHRNRDVRLYELGNIYIPKQLPLTELPDERMQLTLGMYGVGNFFTMKGVVEEIMFRCGLKSRITWDPECDHPYLHPGRKADIKYSDRTVGYIGEVHPKVSEDYGIKDRVYIAVLDMPHIVELSSFDRKYEGIARFPAIKRDISMLAKKDILVGDIELLIAKKAGKLLESTELFDVYEGEQIGEDFRSLAFSLSFRANDRTLSDEEVAEVMEKIVEALSESGVELRK